MGLHLAAILAGVVNGLLGTGGGMLLVPLLGKHLKKEEVFPSCVAMILPLCLVSLGVTAITTPLPWAQALPYLLGSIPGGIAAGLWGKKIPVVWLHRAFGAMILYGGVRYLWW